MDSDSDWDTLTLSVHYLYNIFGFIKNDLKTRTDKGISFALLSGPSHEAEGPIPLAVYKRPDHPETAMDSDSDWDTLTLSVHYLSIFGFIKNDLKTRTDKGISFALLSGPSHEAEGPTNYINK